MSFSYLASILEHPIARYEMRPDAEDDLAQFYAESWNALEANGYEPTEAAMWDAEEELEDGDYVVYHDGEQWQVGHEDDFQPDGVSAYARSISPARYGWSEYSGKPRGKDKKTAKGWKNDQTGEIRYQVKKPVDKSGRKKAVKAGGKAPKPKKEAKAKAPAKKVDLDKHAGELTPAQKAAAKRSFAALLKKHPGEKVLARIGELAHDAKTALADATGPEKAKLELQLRRLRAMAVWAKEGVPDGKAKAAEPKKDEPVDINAFVDKGFEKFYAKDLASERFANLTQEQKDKATATTKAGLKKDLEKVAKSIADKDTRVIDNGMFDTRNPIYRELFTATTGIKLPKTNKATTEAIKDYVGRDKIAAEEAARKAKAEEIPGGFKKGQQVWINNEPFEVTGGHVMLMQGIAPTSDKPGGAWAPFGGAERTEYVKVKGADGKEKHVSPKDIEKPIVLDVIESPDLARRQKATEEAASQPANAVDDAKVQARAALLSQAASVSGKSIKELTRYSDEQLREMIVNANKPMASAEDRYADVKLGEHPIFMSGSSGSSWTVNESRGKELTHAERESWAKRMREELVDDRTRQKANISDASGTQWGRKNASALRGNVNRETKAKLDAIDDWLDAKSPLPTNDGGDIPMPVKDMTSGVKASLGMEASFSSAKTMHDLKPFMPKGQMATVNSALRGEEADYFKEKMAELANRIANMPATYDQDGLGENAVAHLHYFTPGGDWYITEKDKDGGVQQAFGLADPFQDGGELGYISIEELVNAGAELDFYFTPKTLRELKGKEDTAPQPLAQNQPRGMQDNADFASTLGVGMDKVIGEFENKQEPIAPSSTRSPRLTLADTFANRLRNGEVITAKDVLTHADDAYGGTRAQGAHDPSGVYDSLEAGFNKALNGATDPTVDLPDAIAEANRIAAQVATLPTQTNRSGNKVAFQQFSTPPHYAYAVAWLANLDGTDVVLEPTAGTGCLATQAGNSGATVFANELDPKRAEFLKDQLGDDKVTLEDASQIGAILKVKPTVVVMNPPFSQTAGRLGDKKDLMTGANHITQAIQLLQPGGRLVAIVSGGISRDGKKKAGMSMDAATYREWFKKLSLNGYDLRANVGVSGDEYKKYGTNFGTRVLVIDKTGGKSGTVVTGDVESIPELMTMLEGVRNDRPAIGDVTSGERVGGTNAEAGGSDQARDAELLGAGDDGNSGRTVAAGGGESDSSYASGDNELPGGRPGNVGSGDQAKPAGTGVAGPPGSSGQPGGKPKRKAAKGSSGASGGKSAKRVALNVPQLVYDQIGKLRVASLAKIEDSADDAPAEVDVRDQSELGASVYDDFKPTIKIAGMKKHVTPLVESSAMSAVNLPKITYRPLLSPDLIEGKTVKTKLPDGSVIETPLGVSEAGLETICLMGQAHSQFLPAEEGGVPYRRGALNGDGTGSGKGRSVAGTIIDNENQGRTKHVWLSKNYGLINDAKRDFADMGGDPSRIFEFDKLKGDKPPKDGVCFVPYPTLRSGPRDKTQPQNLDILVNWLGQRSTENMDRQALLSAAAGATGKSIDELKKYSDEQLREMIAGAKAFDGVIAFDEAHMMANSTGASSGGRQPGKPSAQALAGIALQNALPSARVGYWTATSATEPENLLFADRLGLWGRGTDFATKEQFINELASGGTAALEAVAQSMKAMGMYNARMVALDDKSERVDKDGNPIGRVENVKLECSLTDAQKKQYDGAAEGWQHVMKRLDVITEMLGGKRSGNSQFWGAQQRFFNQVLTCMATTSVIKAIEKDIEEGRAPVIQLVNTMKASMDRAIQNREEDQELDEIDVGPKEILVNFLNTSFPTHRMEEWTPDPSNPDRIETRLVRAAATAGPKGAEYAGVVYRPGDTIPREVLDEVISAGGDVVGGGLVEDPEAAAEKARLLENAEDLQIPESPLDQLIHKFGTDAVAEVTGRDMRFVWNNNGEKIPEKRGSGAQEADTQAFQDGRKKILVFSGAGNTGKSYHADKRAKNQGRRVHYVLQPGWSAAPLVQALGRTHRSNQTSAPIIRPVAIPDVPGNKRFLSSASRRLESMGALTRGQRQASGGVYGASDNLESPEAIQGLSRFWDRLRGGRIEGLTFDGTLSRLGYEAYNSDGEAKKPPKITQFLNRILVLPIEEQNRVFDAFEKAHQEMIELAIREGTLDRGVENFPADKVKHQSTSTVFTDPSSGAEAQHVVVTTQVKTGKREWRKNTEGTLPIRFVRNSASGKVWAVYDGPQETDPDTGNVFQTYVMHGSSGGKHKVPRLDLDHEYSNYKKITQEEAKPIWEADYAATPDYKEQEENFVTGALLPIWKKIPKSSDFGDKARIFRLKLDNGKMIVGRHIDRGSVDMFLRTMGQHRESKQHNASSVHQRLESGDLQHAKLNNGWKLKPVKAGAGGETRIEILGPSKHDPDIFRDGVLYETIQHKPRFFIPTGPTGVAVMERLTKSRPITEVKDRDSSSMPATPSYVPPVTMPPNVSPAAPPVVIPASKANAMWTFSGANSTGYSPPADINFATLSWQEVSRDINKWGHGKVQKIAVLPNGDKIGYESISMMDDFRESYFFQPAAEAAAAEVAAKQIAPAPPPATPTVQAESSASEHRFHNRPLGSGNREAIERRSGLHPKVGEVVESKSGPRIVIEVSSPQFISNDWIEDNDAWHEYPDGPGWYASYTTAPGDKLPAGIESPKPEPVKATPPPAPVSVKKVTTSKGERHVHSFKPTESLWTLYKSKKKPDYLSVYKNKHSGVWEASVWGNSADEVQKNVVDLRSRGVRYNRDGEPIRYEMIEEDGDDHYQCLAEMYAEHWNQLDMAGLEPSDEGVRKVAEELAQGNWVLYRDSDDEQWKAVRADEAPKVFRHMMSYAQRIGLLRYANPNHKGKGKGGGQFTSGPGGAKAKAKDKSKPKAANTNRITDFAMEQALGKDWKDNLSKLPKRSNNEASAEGESRKARANKEKYNEAVENAVNGVWSQANRAANAEYYQSIGHPSTQANIDAAIQALQDSNPSLDRLGMLCGLIGIANDHDFQSKDDCYKAIRERFKELQNGNSPVAKKPAKSKIKAPASVVAKITAKIAKAKVKLDALAAKTANAKEEMAALKAELKAARVSTKKAAPAVNSDAAMKTGLDYQ